MRIPDALLMAFAVIAAPSLAWAYGRFAGRRDWKLLPLLGGTVLIAAGILGIMALLHSPAVAGRAAAAAAPISEALTSPEFGAFVLIFATLVAMLGWSSVPVIANKRD
jgi:hypothetical protein